MRPCVCVCLPSVWEGNGHKQTATENKTWRKKSNNVAWTQQNNASFTTDSGVPEAEQLVESRSHGVSSASPSFSFLNLPWHTVFFASCEPLFTARCITILTIFLSPSLPACVFHPCLISPPCIWNQPHPVHPTCISTSTPALRSPHVHASLLPQTFLLSSACWHFASAE